MNERPAGFHSSADESLASAVYASPMPTARAPTGICKRSALVEPGPDARANALAKNREQKIGNRKKIGTCRDVVDVFLFAVFCSLFRRIIGSPSTSRALPSRNS